MNRRQKKRHKWLIGGLVIALAIIGMSLLNLNTYSVYFYTPGEALAQAQGLHEKEIKVGGMVKAGSVRWQPEDLALAFTLTDMGSAEIEVSHKGTPPDMFKESSGVVVEGRISADGSNFVAKTLMVKHSEEYKAPDDGHSLDKELVKKSIFK